MAKKFKLSLSFIFIHTDVIFYYAVLKNHPSTPLLQAASAFWGVQNRTSLTMQTGNPSCSMHSPVPEQKGEPPVLLSHVHVMVLLGASPSPL